MPMADEITPALTADEWARRLVVIPCDGKFGPVQDATALLSHGLLTATSPGFALFPRIAAAALALANDALPPGHPIKITREDLRWIEDFEDACHNDESRAWHRRFSAKLAAILPPENR